MIDMRRSKSSMGSDMDRAKYQFRSMFRSNVWIFVYIVLDRVCMARLMKPYFLVRFNRMELAKCPYDIPLCEL